MEALQSSHFVVSDQVKFQYAGIFVMYVICKEGHEFDFHLHPDDRVLEPILKWILEEGYAQLHQQKYVLSKKGMDVLNIFLDRYQMFLEEFDIFCGVDLEQKEFAFAYYDRYEDADAWHEFLSSERWADLRIAVAEYKGLDPIELVLMSLIHEGRFGRDDYGWNEDLLLGGIWEEIQSICNTSLRLSSLSTRLKKKEENSEAFLSDIIHRGSLLMQEFRR